MRYRTRFGRPPFHCLVGAYTVRLEQSNAADPDASRGGGYSHEAFLRGAGQGEVRQRLGQDVLDEVLETVRHADELPELVAERRADLACRNRWRRIPQPPELLRLAAAADPAELPGDAPERAFLTGALKAELHLDSDVRVGSPRRSGAHVLVEYSLSGDECPPLAALLGRRGWLAITPGEVVGWYSMEVDR